MKKRELNKTLGFFAAFITGAVLANLVGFSTNTSFAIGAFAGLLTTLIVEGIKKFW